MCPQDSKLGGGSYIQNCQLHNFLSGVPTCLGTQLSPSRSGSFFASWERGRFLLSTHNLRQLPVYHGRSQDSVLKQFTNLFFCEGQWYSFSEGNFTFPLPVSPTLRNYLLCETGEARWTWGLSVEGLCPSAKIEPVILMMIIIINLW